MPEAVYFLLFRLYRKILPRQFFALAFILGNFNITYSNYVIIEDELTSPYV